MEELRWFVVLAEAEHMTDAAAELGVSQPTLSRALGRLEAQVGAPLFDRINRRLHLNSYGQIMAEHARRSIQEIQSASDRIAALRDADSGTVRLAFLHSLASWFVPDLLRRPTETDDREIDHEARRPAIAIEADVDGIPAVAVSGREQCHVEPVADRDFGDDIVVGGERIECGLDGGEVPLLSQVRKERRAFR